MRFLLIVLAIHLIIELVANKRNAIKNGKNDEASEKVRHPAEYGLR